MRVCFVNMPIEYYSPASGGAVSTVIAELTDELARLGHDVDVVTYTDDNGVHEAGRVVDLGPIPRLPQSLRAIDRVTRRTLRRPFHAYEQYRRAATRAIRRLAPPPDVLVAFNDFVAPEFLRRAAPAAKLLSWWENEPPPVGRRALRSVDAVVGASDFVRDRAVAAGVPAAQALTIPNGVNLRTFNSAPRDWQVPRVLCIGRLDHNKGFHVALQALQSARAQGLEFDTTLAGARWWYGTGEPSAYERELFAAVDALGGNYVGLVSRDRVPTLYREHDLVYVLSLSQEPFGLVVLEAMASGCAVIASPRGGIPQAAGDAALLVDPDRPDDVLEATMRLLGNPAELAAWQQRAMSRASRASWAKSAGMLVDLAVSLGVQ